MAQTVRLEPIPPDRLSPEQRRLYDTMQAGIAKSLQGFVVQRDDGALVGPFVPMLHFPNYGAAAWSVFTALSEHATLPKNVREVAILVTGAQLGARYEVYAHERVAAAAGLPSAKIATLAAGERPNDLDADEAVAYDVASALMRGRQLPDSTYQAATEAFGKAGAAELIYVVGCYSLISILLNAYDIPVPGNDAA